MSKNKNNISYIDDELINIKRCFDGVIETKDGRFVSAIEILPVNFKFKTGNEQSKIIRSFEKYLKIAPIKLQFKVVTKNTDVGSIITTNHKKFADNYDFSIINKSIKDLHIDELYLIDRLGSYNSVSRKFYIILEYCPTTTYVAKNDSDIVNYINNAKETAKKYLARCGNVVLTHRDEEYFLVELFYSILNKKKTKDDFYKEWNKIVDDVSDFYNYDEEIIEKTEFPFDHLLAPTEIKLFSEYCKIDGTYYSFFFIHSNGYPPVVAPAWLSGLINSGEGIDVDIFINQENKSKIRNDLRSHSRLNRVRVKKMDQNGENYEEATQSLMSSEYIKNKLSEGDLFYYINILVTISGNSYEEMNTKYNAVKEMLDSNDIRVMDCRYMVEKGIKSYMPINDLDKSFFEKTKRNVTSSDFAGFFPFTSFEVSDDDGTVMGINKDNNSLVILDLFNTQKYKNANMAILGTSGAGKTFTLGITLKRMAMQGIRTFLIAPLKGHEYSRICKSIGGQVIKISAGSPNCINVMEIRPENLDTKKQLGILSDDEEEIILNNKVTTLKTFFSLLIKDMSYTEKELLDRAILETYRRKGITKDNDSLIDHYEKVKLNNGKYEDRPVYKEMPILKDLYNVLKEDEKTERMSDILYSYVEGSASSFNGQTNVNLDSPFTVLDISNLSKELIPIGMFLALDYVWDKSKEDVTEKKVIAIDETWMLIKNSELAAEFVLEIFKIIRGYGGSAIAASQDIKDFFALNDGEYGEAIISNSKNKIILNLEPKEASTVQEILNLSNKEREDIESFERGNMLVVSNSNTFTLEFVASDIELKLITTDKKMLRVLMNDKRFVNGVYTGEIKGYTPPVAA